MTALITQLLGATFSAPNILIPPLPVATGTTPLWCYVGGSAAQSPNLMTGAAMTQVGTPTYQSAYATFMAGASAAALDTGLKDDTKTFSLLFAVRNTTGLASPSVAVPIGNVDNTTFFGVDVRYSTTGLLVTTNASGISRTLAVSSIGNWKIFAVSFDDVAHVQNIWNLSDSTTDNFTGTGSRNLSATGNWWIGANSRTAIGNQPGDVAFAGLIKGQAINLTAAQQYAANIRANLALRGLTVP